MGGGQNMNRNMGNMGGRGGHGRPKPWWQYDGRWPEHEPQHGQYGRSRRPNGRPKVWWWCRRSRTLGRT